MKNANERDFLGGFNGISALQNFPSDKEDPNPYTGLSEDENRIKLELGLPMFQKKDIKVTIDEHKVSVYGCRTLKDRISKTKDKIEFKRIFQVPPSIRKEDIRVTHNERILSLIMPKRNF